MMDLNGKGHEIYDDVKLIKGSVSKLEDHIDKLAMSVDGLSSALSHTNLSTERTIKYVMEANEKTVGHVKNSLPIRIVCLLCFIICIAFIGGGLLKEIIDNHLLVKWFSSAV